MKNFLVALLVFLVWSVIGLWIYSLGNNLNIAKNNQTQDISEINTSSPEAVIDSTIFSTEIVKIENTPSPKEFQVFSLNEEILLESNQTISIIKDSSQVILPADLSALPSILASHLYEHPGQEVHIASYYSPSEKLRTPSIGEQRGNSFKKMLVDEGVDLNQIVVKPVISTANFETDDSFLNGMTFSFRLLDRDRIENLKSTIPDVITFYPSYNFDEILANKKLVDFSDSIVSLSEAYPDLKINVIGHTDHIGASSENYLRGLKSARQIRWYLVTKGGLDRKNIIALSKGESEPLLHDGKPASRKENARIEIQFSEKE